MSPVVANKVAYISSYLRQSYLDSHSVGPEEILFAAYERSDLCELTEVEADALFGEVRDVLVMAMRIDELLDWSFEKSTQLAQGLVNGGGENIQGMDVTMEGQEYVVALSEEQKQSSDAIPQVIDKLLEYNLKERAGGNASTPEFVAELKTEIKEGVIFEFAPVIISDIYNDIFDDSYCSIPSASPFIGIFGEDESEHVLVIPTNTPMLPDRESELHEIFDRVKSVSDASGVDIFVASLFAVFNRYTEQTCIGYGYSSKNEKWFPVYITAEKSFIECFNASLNDQVVVDKKQLVAHVYARVQAGLKNAPFESYATYTLEYPDSDWAYIEMESLIRD